MKHERRTGRPVLRQEGFSIVEVIVVLAIIGILTLILVPVVSNRAREARLKAAAQDLENLANAMERAGVDTDYLYPLRVLDDVAMVGDNNRNDFGATDVIDGTRDEDLPPYSKQIFIRPNDFQFAPNYTDLYDNRFCINTDLTSETDFGWHGPYINWQNDVNDNDWPDDPWGRDYILFGIYSAGAMGPNETNFVFTNINMGTGWSANTRVFDRGVILSVGPDGLPGNAATNPAGDGVYGTGDDIYRKF